MDFKTIKSATLFDVVMTILIVIGIFTGMFLWLNSNAQNSGIAVDSKYNETYARLNNASATLDKNVDDIKTNLNKITEADNLVQQAWNGLKGLGSVLKLPISIVSTAEQTFEAITINLDTIPPWAKVLIFIGIVALVVLIVLSILKGDPNVIR